MSDKMYMGNGFFKAGVEWIIITTTDSLYYNTKYYNKIKNKVIYMFES